MTTNNQETLRASLVQFFGALLISSPNGEVASGIIMEELTKMALTEEDKFNTDMIKPIFKSVVYILTVRYNKLLSDAKSTFNSNIPKNVQKSLDSQKELIDQLNKYIGELI